MNDVFQTIRMLGLALVGLNKAVEALPSGDYTDEEQQLATEYDNLIVALEEAEADA